MADAVADDLVFLDECGITTAMTPSHGYAPRGEPVIEKVPRNRGNVTTVLGALDQQGMVAMMTIDAPTNKAVFLNFLTGLLPEIAGKTLVMDNLGAHRVKEVLALCEAHSVRVKYLPPYSPEFNPIEPAWFWMKDGLRKVKARTRADLDVEAEALFHKLPAAHAKAWFRFCGYRVAR